MPQARDEAGNIWETDAQGQPLRLVSQAGASGYTVPSNPAIVSRDQAREGRDNAAAGRDDTRTGIAVRGEGRDVRNTHFDQTLKLRSDYDAMPAVKEYRVALPQLALALKTTPDGAGDNALIYAYAKAMDPGSVVRESEMTMAGSAGSWLETRAAQIKKNLGIEGGGQLSDNVREGLRREMVGKVQELNRAYTAQRARYSDDASNFGLDPVRVIGQHDGSAFLPELERYDRNRRGNAFDTTGAGANLAGGGDNKKALPIPADMQAEYEQFVQSRRGSLDPDEFASFRDQLDQKYGYAPNSPERIAENRAWALNANKSVQSGAPLNMRLPSPEADMTGLDRFNATMFNNPVGAALMAAPPFAGGMDEVAGFAKSAVTGSDYELERNRMDAMRQAARDEYPGASVAGQIAGGVGAAYAGGGIPALARAGSTLPGIVGFGAGAGAVQGALEDNADRGRGAMIGGGAGAAGGLAGRYVVAPAVEAASRSRLAENALSRGARALSAITGKPVDLPNIPRLDSSESIVSRVRPDWNAIRANIADASDMSLPYALADADPKLRVLAGTVARKSVNARDLAEKTFEPRALGQADRAIENIDKMLAPLTDIAARQRELRNAGNIASSPFYRMAGERVNPIPPGMGPVVGQPSGGDREISAMLGTPSGKDALRRAYRIAADNGRNPESLGLVQDGAGNVVLRQGSSFETLDLVKKGLDARIQEAADPITGKINFQGNPELQALEGLRKRFVERMDATNPDYRQARESYAPYGQAAEALEMGFQGTTSRLPPRDLASIVGGMKPHQIDEYRRGYATSLADKAEAMRMQSDPYKAIAGAPAQLEKIGTLFPNASRFNRLTQLEGDMSKTRYETLGGSPTAARMQADQQLGSGFAQDGLNAAGSMLTGGGAPSMGSAGLALGRRFMAGRFGDAANAVTEKRADEIAPRLFDTKNPQSILDFLDGMIRKNQEIEARKATARRYGGLIGSMSAPGFAAQ